MKCPKCNYTSFDYLSECKKCGESLEESRQALNLQMVEPTIFPDQPDQPDQKENLKNPSPTETGNQPSPAPRVSPAKVQEPIVFAPDSEEDREWAALGSLGNTAEKSDFEISPEIDFSEPPASPVAKGEEESDSSELELSQEFGLNQNTPFNDNITDDTNEGLILTPEKDLTETSELTNCDLPFDFSRTDEQENQSAEKITDSGDTCIELELDMDDDESIDQILADLEEKDA